MQEKKKINRQDKHLECFSISTAQWDSFVYFQTSAPRQKWSFFFSITNGYSISMPPVAAKYLRFAAPHTNIEH